MKGLLFYDLDRGCGGPEGFIAYYQTWCVEIEGKKKYHVHSKVTGPSPGYTRHDVGVKPCDGSCMKIVDIPDTVWDKVRSQFDVA